MKLSGFPKIVVIVLIALAALIVIAVGALYIAFPPSRLKAVAIPQIEKQLGRKVEVGKIGFTFFPLFGVKVGDLAVANTTRPGFSPEPFVSLRKFVLAVEVLPLLHKQLSISRIVIKNPRILVETDERGSFNFDDLAFMKKDSTKAPDAEKPSGGMPALPIPLSLKQFFIESGTVVYHDRKGNLHLTLGTINENLVISMDRSLKNVTTTGNLIIDSISFQSKEVTKPLTGLTVTLSHDLLVNVVDELLTINDLRASLQKVAVAVKGSVSGFGGASPVLDLAVTSSKIDLADLVAEIPASLVPEIAKVKASGTMEATMTIKGPLPQKGALPLDGRALINNVRIHYADLPKTINDFNADIGFTANSINIAALRLKLGENPLSLSGTVNDFAKPLIDIALNAAINLGDLKDIVPLPEGMSFSGNVKADVKAKGIADPADPAKLNLRGIVGLTKVSVVTPAVTKPVVFDGAINLTSRSIAPAVLVKIGTSSVNFKADLVDYLPLFLPDSTKKYPRSRLQCTLVSPYLNTDEFLPQNKASTGKPDKTAASKPALAVNPAAAPLILPEALPGVDVTATVSNERLIYQGLDVRAVAFKLSSINDIVKVNASLGIFGGKMNHKVNVDMRNNRNLQAKLLLTGERIDMHQMAQQLKTFIPPTVPLSKEIANLDKALYGTGGMRCDLATSGGTVDDLTKHLSGTVDLDLKNGKIVGAPLVRNMAKAVEKFYKIDDIEFRDMKINARIKDGRVYFDKPVSIQSRVAGDWQVTGNVGFDANLGLSVANRLSKNMSDKVLSLQNKGQKVVKGLLQGTRLAGVSGLVDQAGIPSDAQGRVTMLLGVEGGIASPKVTFRGFGAGSGKQAAAKQPSVKKQLQQTVDRKKQELEAKLAAEKQKAAEEVQRRTNEEKKRLEEATKQKSGQVKDAAVKKLKKLF
ncbi:MAG: AsmA family protein [Chitinispirillaceae bacterium]|nr:AsmA family protein [Chitinispirillaceae bacterium]